jgi:hypothetical protein
VFPSPRWSRRPPIDGLPRRSYAGVRAGPAVFRITRLSRNG